MHIKAVSYELEERAKKLLAVAICAGVITYAALFYFFFDYLYSYAPVERMFIGIALFIPFTPLLVEAMLHRNFIRRIGKEKWISLGADGIEIKDTVRRTPIERHISWEQVSGIRVHDVTYIIGKMTKRKLMFMRVFTDRERYTSLREQYARSTLETYHQDELRECYFDLEYMPSVVEEIKRHCATEIVLIKGWE